MQRIPDSYGCRLALTRMFFRNGREPDAVPLATELAGHGNAECCFYLGVDATRRHDYKTALFWMKRAMALDPGNKETENQIALLESTLGS